MELGGSGAQALHDAALALEAAEAELRLKRVVSVHEGELGESLRQLARLGLGETVVGGVEVVVNGVGVGAVLNGNKVVVGGGEVLFP